MEGIGIGVSDFKILRIRQNYYIDKTMFIKDIIDNQSSVILITRPRRFGKTLNMSMLKYYFDCTQKDNKELFKNLKIMKEGEKYTSKIGCYPCIYLTLKDVLGTNFEEMILSLKSEILEIYIDNANLLKSNKLLDIEKEIYNKILNLKANNIEIQSSIKFLSKILYKEYEKPVMLFLDEYDVPLQNAYTEGFYEETIKFFKAFYGITFKDNSYLEKTVITGVSRVAKESIFSGANNFKVYTVLENEFSEDFEITEIIKKYKKKKQKKIKKWYDGYKIGDTEGIYNPWSILNYLVDRELIPYWVNTSSNDLIKLILKNSSSIKEKIERLLRDEDIEVTIDQETIITGIEKREENIWGLLLGTGYLKITEKVDIVEKKYKVKIPNYEIKALFQSIIRNWFSNKIIGNDLNSILKDLITLNLKEFEKKFDILVRQMFSYMDVGENTAENFYHAFVLGMLVGLKDKYYVNSNRESGLGRYDILLEPKNKNDNSFIIEFKVSESKEEKNIEETIKNAKKQIVQKKYEENLKERGYKNITKIVIAFKGKKVKMCSF